MIHKSHPTHARTTRRLAAVFMLFAAISWLFGFFFSDGNGESTQSLIQVSLFMFFGILALFTLVARAYVCKCPDCGRWLTKQEKVDVDEFPRRFICQHCAVTWDSKVKVGY
jgi:hypothetical protein